MTTSPKSISSVRTGQSTSGPGGVHAISFHRGDKTTRTFDLVDLDRELADSDVFSWIDIQGSQIGVLNDVLKRLGIDLVLADHFDEPEILPRIVERRHCLAFYLYEVEDPEHHLDTAHGLRDLEVLRMILVVGDDFVLTYHTTELDVVTYVREQCEESFRQWGKTQGFIAFLLIQKCLYDYAHLNLANDNYLDHLGTRVRSGDPDKLAADVATASANILTLKKLATSLHIVLMLLATKRNVFVTDEARAFYHEMLGSASSVRDAIDSSRDMLDGVLGAVQASAARRTGEIARVLTVVSTIILPLTLITGIYGMNFDVMPELRVKWAYFAVLGFLVGAGATLLGVFWKLGWVGSRRAE